MIAYKSSAQRVACGAKREVAALRALKGQRAVNQRHIISARASATPENPLRQALSQVVTGVYKSTAMFSQAETGMSPLWSALTKLDLAGVKAAIGSGADLNERNANGDTALLQIARAGHYKYPPSEIPTALIKAGADMEAADKNGLTALQVSLMSGWQNISELLIKSGASTAGVAAIKGRLTCPDCKRVVAQYKL